MMSSMMVPPLFFDRIYKPHVLILTADARGQNLTEISHTRSILSLESQSSLRKAVMIMSDGLETRLTGIPVRSHWYQWEDLLWKK